MKIISDQTISFICTIRAESVCYKQKMFYIKITAKALYAKNFLWTANTTKKAQRGEEPQADSKSGYKVEHFKFARKWMWNT